MIFVMFFFYPLYRLGYLGLHEQNRFGTNERYVGFGQYTDVLTGDEFLAPVPGDAQEQQEAAPPPPEPGEPAMALDRQTVTRVQSALNEAGFNLAVDGLLGPNTQAAIEEFQRRRGLPPDGNPTQPTLRALGLAPAR